MVDVGSVNCFRITAVCFYTLLSTAAFAGDWPQILGPNRDGVAVGEKLAKEWPDSGPKVLWSQPVGQAFAGVAVEGDMLILFHRVDDEEVVESRSVTDGSVNWSSPYACDYVSGMSSDSGPRCVPLIDDGMVYTFGASGILRCVQLQNGKEVWKRDTWQDFKAPEGYFGAGSSPLLVGDSLIVNVGGRDNAAVVCFDVKTGKTKWQKFSDTASYSSPVAATFNGQQHAIVVTRLNTVSFDPANGAIRFQFPFGARGPTVNGASPVVLGDKLFVSSSYRVGSVLATVTESGVETQESGETLLATQYATPVRQGNLLYCVDGRQDIGSASLCCINPIAGEVVWKQDGFDYGTLTRVETDILFVTCGGELIRFKANPLGFRKTAQHSILDPTPRGHRLPALSNGKLFVRDDSTLKCLSVGPDR